MSTSGIIEDSSQGAHASGTLVDAEKHSLEEVACPENMDSADVHAEEKAEPGLHWSAAEVQEIPYNNMKIVVLALMIATLLSALDQTIAAVSLPNIVEDIGGETEYGWVGSAYLLMSSCFNPLWGRLSDITGRKPILFFSIGTFLLGSALCGAAQSFIWLALCRGVQGIGAGGCTQMVMVTISDITNLQERSKYVNLMGATMGIASVLGPLIGGALTDHASWRWCFWINLPIGGLAAVLLFSFLHLKRTKRRTIGEVVSTFDFIGLFLFTAGSFLLIFGFEDVNTASEGWHAPQTLTPLVIGAVLVISGGIHEVFTKREPVIPPRLFRTRTTAACLITVFIHTFVFFGVVYFVPLYFQVLGSSATMAGVRLLLLPLGAAVTSMGSGMMLPKTGKYRSIMWAGAAIMTLGVGLLIMLDEKTSIAKQEVWLFVMGLGVGCLFQTPLIALHSAMPLKDMATSTASYQLLRTLGGTIGITIGNTIFQSELSKRLANISGSSTFSSNGSRLPDFTAISRIQPDSLRQQVSHAFTRSIATIYIAFTPISFVAFLLLLTIREYSLKRNYEREPKRVREEVTPATPTDPNPESRRSTDC